MVAEDTEIIMCVRLWNILVLVFYVIVFILCHCVQVAFNSLHMTLCSHHHNIVFSEVLISKIKIIFPAAVTFFLSYK